MKNFLLNLIRSLPIGVVRQEKLLLFLKLGYWPDFRSPRTFNEKINCRKLFSDDELMVSCMDKIAVRDYVAEKIGDEYLIPLLFTGESISAQQLHALGDNIVAKPSHDSKSTEIISSNTAEVARAAAARLQAKVKIDFGRQTNQFAYSKVPPRILVERMLIDRAKVTPDDYKIFCFRQPDGSTKMHIEVHENREQADYKVTVFNETLEPIELTASDYGTGAFPCPAYWPRMRAIAERLSVDFDHVRIDLYLVEDRIYFGEMTFFDGGGRTDYSTVGGVRNDLDYELGRIWHYGQNFPAAQKQNAAVQRPPSASAVSP